MAALYVTTFQVGTAPVLLLQGLQVAIRGEVMLLAGVEGHLVSVAALCCTVNIVFDCQ